MPGSDDFEILPSASKARASSPPSGTNKDDKAAKEATAQSEEIKCEVKEYEARYDLEGKRILKAVELSSQDADLKDDGKYVMRLYKYYTRDAKIEKVNLEIRSPHIRDALRNVIGSYPEQNFTGHITLTGNNESLALACLFHYRKELREYRDNLEDASARQHVLLLVDFAEREFRRDIHRFEASIQAATPSVEFRDLWMLFKPNDLVFSGENHTQSINKVVKVSLYPGSANCPSKWAVTAKALSHDGSHYGYIHRCLEIVAFDGIREVNTLSSYPVKFHLDQYALRKYLVYRGKKYCSLTGVQHRAYDGEAVMVDKVRTVAYSGRVNTSYPSETIQLGGRIILDCKLFIEERTESGIKIAEVKLTEPSSFTEDDYMLCHYAMMGFSLTEKLWCCFFVDFIDDVVFDDGAFDALLLPARHKRLVRALTKRHTSGTDGFDDLIRGKGHGCIFLLHGEPGIGKTFTAESIADEIQRPLYVLMSGELGSDVQTVDQRFRKVLELVTAWNAVLLIDEADVFLERRSSHDLARNSLVSVFLRTLEYFSGVLFLTTNRISTFDRAFQSRIHLALKYQPLDADAREYLWRLFLQRTPGFRAEDWQDETLKELAAADINGRQIKNTVRTAYALALAEDQRLGVEQVRDVLETVGEFQEDFNQGTREQGVSDADGTTSLTLQNLGLPDEAGYETEEHVPI
ncbi:hypothetical protein F5X99DRAFT_102437 [Biscogniauxia marginata]|nr:hypothetical protein F5X99DRAFT_102437 [Biscogniauxia marginata]